MFEPDENGVITSVTATSFRRIVATLILGVLGFLLLSVMLGRPLTFVTVVTLGGFGVISLALSYLVWQSTGGSVYLTETDVRDSDGRILAELADIEKVERGVFAIKPSNGFVLITKKPQGRMWAPGLYWRLGRRVGIGGVVPAGATKFMAEQIAFRIAS